jgi:hypothetical protein
MFFNIPYFEFNVLEKKSLSKNRKALKITVCSYGAIITRKTIIYFVDYHHKHKKASFRKKRRTLN